MLLLLLLCLLLHFTCDFKSFIALYLSDPSLMTIFFSQVILISMQQKNCPMKHLEATLLFNFDFFLLYFLTRWTFFFAWRSFMSLHFSIDVLCMYELWIFLFWKIRCLIAHHHHSSFFTLRVPLWDLRDADNIINHIFLYHVWRSTVLFLLAASFSSIYWRSNGAFIHFWNSFYQGLLQPPENWGCVWFLKVLKKPQKCIFSGFYCIFMW